MVWKSMPNKCLFVAGAVAFGGLLAACEESVSPILESDQQVTLFGALDMARDTQFVRVIPIRPTLAPSEEVPELSVRSIDLTNGQMRIWRDSLVYYADGSPGFVYYSPFSIRPGHTYRIEIQPSGSELVTSAETTVPEEPAITVLPEVVEFRLLATSTRLVVTQSLHWEGINVTPFAAEIWYRLFQVSDFTFRDIRLPDALVQRPLEPGGWQYEIDLLRDRDSLAKQVDLTSAVALAGLGMTVTVLDDEFIQPGGVFDPEVIAQPGTRSNVTNGFGFLGSVGRFSVEWLLADSTMKTLGYNLMEPLNPHTRAWKPTWPDVPGVLPRSRPASGSD